jgi:hypothetical protein
MYEFTIVNNILEVGAQKLEYSVPRATYLHALAGLHAEYGGKSAKDPSHAIPGTIMLVCFSKNDAGMGFGRQWKFLYPNGI